MAPDTQLSNQPQPGTAGTAAAVDHIGPVRDPYRVTIMRLARRNETYEIRWRENLRHDDGTVTRKWRTEPGGHSKAIAYTQAEKIHRNLIRTNGYHGAPARPKGEPKAPPRPKTLKQVADLWLAQHPSNPTKPGTVEGYASLMHNNILPALTYPETSGRRTLTRTVELGVMIADDIVRADINHWTNALSVKPDARCKSETRAISPSTVNTCLRVLNACLNWGVAHGHLTKNPANGVEVTVHGTRDVEWFRTANDFWTALDHIDTKYNGALHNLLVASAYLGLRVNELAALQWNDVDLHRHRINIEHNFDKKRRTITVKSTESETWLPLHPEAETAIQDQKTRLGAYATGQELVFRGPRGGIITSTLVNDALTHGCTKASLGYRVTAHGLRHSFGNWLKNAGVPTRDIQAVLRHADLRTTNGYLHTSTEEKITAIAKLPRRAKP